MKKKDVASLRCLVLFGMVFLCQIIYAQSESVILKFDFTRPRIVGGPTYDNITYDSIIVNSLDGYGAPGLPIMPFRTVRILIPQDSDPEDVEIIRGREIKLDGRYKIECGQTPVPISSGMVIKTEPNQAVYSSTEPFPGKLYSQMPVQHFRGYKVLILNLYPVQYIPKGGLISYFQDMTVKVNLKPTTELSPFFRDLPKDKAEVMKRVDNPDEVDTYTEKLERPHRGCICDPNESYDYVIITNNALKNSSSDPNFHDLVSWKDERWIKATIVTVEDINDDADYRWDGTYGDGSEFFDDTAARIRNFIKDAFINWGIEYVLLGGDGDTDDVEDNIIPCRGFYDGLGEENTPADLYYAALDGNWNNDEDSRWAEYDPPEVNEADFMAEVYVGRAPVDSEQELSNFVKKTIAYEEAKDSDPYLEKVYMVGEDLSNVPWAHLWGGDYKDDIKEIFPSSYDIELLYERINYEREEPYWDYNDIVAIINAGTHIFNHLGHSYNEAVMKVPYWHFDEDIINEDYCFVYSMGCYAGAFDNWRVIPTPGYSDYDSIAEYFVVGPSGAFAFVANSRNGGDGSQAYDMQFWDAVFRENICAIGKANQDSKEDNIGSVCYPIMRRYYYELNLLGDPSVCIWRRRLFCVENSSGEAVVWFDTNLGDLYMKGTLYEFSDHESSYNDEFIFQDTYGYENMIIDANTGDVYLRGFLYEEEDPLTPPTYLSNIIIKNVSGNVVAYVDYGGHLHLKGNVYENQ